MSDCGGCVHFLKIKKGNWGNSGLCEKSDCRTDEDCGHHCKDFKAKKYQRKKFDYRDELEEESI